MSVELVAAAVGYLIVAGLLGVIVGRFLRNSRLEANDDEPLPAEYKICPHCRGYTGCKECEGSGFIKVGKDR